MQYPTFIKKWPSRHNQTFHSVHINRRLAQIVWVTKDTVISISHELFPKIIHSLSHICNSAYDSALFSAAITLTIFGLLRVESVRHWSCNDMKIKCNLLCQITILYSKPNGFFLCCGHNSSPDVFYNPSQDNSPAHFLILFYIYKYLWIQTMFIKYSNYEKRFIP